MFSREKAGLHRDAIPLPIIDVLEAQERGDGCEEDYHCGRIGSEIFKQPAANDWCGSGDRISYYCILDETGNVILEQRCADNAEGMQQVFSKISHCRIALETGTHSPWVSRLLTQLGHDAIVAHARNVRLITESSRKDDRLDARTLATLARIDPEFV